MQIEFSFSGGYGGLFAAQPRRCDFDSDELPEVDRERLHSLIQSSRILTFSPGQYTAGDAPQRDIFVYSLSITDAGSTRVFKFDDVSAPSSVQPLLQFLKELALRE
jgi:hypothetical protein